MHTHTHTHTHTSQTDTSPTPYTSSLSLSFPCSCMHTRTGRPTQWRGEGGLASHSLKGLPSCVGRPVQSHTHTPSFRPSP